MVLAWKLKLEHWEGGHKKRWQSDVATLMLLTSTFWFLNWTNSFSIYPNRPGIMDTIYIGPSISLASRFKINPVTLQTAAEFSSCFSLLLLQWLLQVRWVLLGWTIWVWSWLLLSFAPAMLLKPLRFLFIYVFYFSLVSILSHIVFLVFDRVDFVDIGVMVWGNGALLL